MEIYDFVHEQDSKGFENDEPRGWIQWKGTDVCIDLHCVCGHHGHFDGDFFYFFECPACHAKYAVGCNVKLIPLPPEIAAQVGAPKTCDFRTCELDEDD